MKILLSLENGLSHPAGGERYLSTVCDYLTQQGHEIKEISNTSEYPIPDMRDIWIAHNDLYQWCDIAFTQLLGTALGFNKAKQHNKPLVFFAHNTVQSYPVRYMNEAHVVYNCETTKAALGWEHNSLVLPPVVKQYSRDGGKYITLINCNENKGGEIMVELAKLLPQCKFMGVTGYDKQITAHDIRYVTDPDMSTVYSQTKILIVPSASESWSMAASEACKAGIPVICSPLPGLKENLSYAGIYIDRNNVNSYANEIIRLMEDKEYYESQSELCLQRSKEYENKLPEFETWLKSIVNDRT